MKKIKNIEQYFAGPSSPSKYSLEVGIAIAAYRGNRTQELVSEGFSYEDAAKIADKEINENWG